MKEIKSQFSQDTEAVIEGVKAEMMEIKSQKKIYKDEEELKIMPLSPFFDGCDKFQDTEVVPGKMTERLSKKWLRELGLC